MLPKPDGPLRHQRLLHRAAFRYVLRCDSANDRQTLPHVLYCGLSALLWHRRRWLLRRQSVPGIEARLGRTLDEQGIRALLEVHGEIAMHKPGSKFNNGLPSWRPMELK